MSLPLLVYGGNTISKHRVLRTDIGIEHGKIVWRGIANRKRRNDSRVVVDASGCWLLPGAIDPHVHFALPIGHGISTCDDFESGSRAGLAGGVTSFIDYTTPRHGQPPWDAFVERRRLADGAACGDYSLHNVLTSWKPQWQKDLRQLAKAGAPSVKLFMIYRDRGWQADDGMLLEVMEHCRALGMVVCVHAENDALIGLYTKRLEHIPPSRRSGAFDLALSRPPLVEEEAVARAICLAAASGARLHLVHLSAANSALLVGAARQAGIRVSAETCPQYLMLDQSLLKGRQGHLFTCCPPLRSREDRGGLWRALKHGWISALATDHCAFSRKQKDGWGKDISKIPFGLPGVETALRVTFSYGPMAKRLSVHQWITLHSEGPAKLFGLYPTKGSLQVGADADMILWDPAVRKTIRAAQAQSPCDWSPYQGMALSGWPQQVFLRGVEVAREGRSLGLDPMGRYICRQADKVS